MSTPLLLLLKSSLRVRVSSFLLLLFIFASSSAKIPYSPHCSSFVPDSTPTTQLPSPAAAFRFSAGYFTGGDRLLGRDPNSNFAIPKSISFRPLFPFKTLNPDTLKIAGTLILRGGAIRIPRQDRGRGLRLMKPGPHSFSQRGRVSFDVEGFWSNSTGKLCMVGNGVGRSKEGIPLQFSAVFKLNYPNPSNISSSVAAGTLESVDAVGSLNYFDLVRVLVYSQNDYAFTKVTAAVDSCSRVKIGEESIGFDKNRTCAYLHDVLGQRFKFTGSCSGRYCGPFSKGVGSSPRFFVFNGVQCADDGRLRMYISFTDRESFGSSKILDPENALVSEGAWVSEKGRLCLVACRVLNASVSNSLSGEAVGDCTIGLSLWVPSVLSIENMSMTYGRIWSNRDRNDGKYFDTVSFRDVESSLGVPSVPGVVYKYTQMDRVKKYCPRSDTGKIKKNEYPDGKYLGEMRFNMYFVNADNKGAWGYGNPRFVGEEPYSRYSLVDTIVASSTGLSQSLSNVSYKIAYSFMNVSVHAYETTEISAEGTYDAQTGTLCMVGCRQMDSSMDCEILINIHLAPLNPKEGEHLTGTIKSTRKKSDVLFFKPLDISSYGIYATQAAETILWMDIEIIMVLISLTFSCIFIGLQLYYIKQNPDVLPSISITMLVVLTLGHMIPLVLTFEALFVKNRNQQNVLLGSGGWLQVHEVIVRVITLVAFLLQFRLLQVAWSSRSGDPGKKDSWGLERKTLLCCLPLYIVGGLVALLFRLGSVGTKQNHLSLWEYLMSYAGFILDSFLFPQLIYNVFWNSKDKSLALSFYIGTTVVRALPHVYDAYRAHHYIPHINPSYIYANRNRDFYSSAWDIIIPCEGVILAVLVYLQQRFGGAFILPQRFRESGGYEMVPVSSH